MAEATFQEINPSISKVIVENGKGESIVLSDVVTLHIFQNEVPRSMQVPISILGSCVIDHVPDYFTSVSLPPIASGQQNLDNK